MRRKILGDREDDGKVPWTSRVCRMHKCSLAIESPLSSVDFLL